MERLSQRQTLPLTPCVFISLVLPDFGSYLTNRQLQVRVLGILSFPFEVFSAVRNDLSIYLLFADNISNYRAFKFPEGRLTLILCKVGALLAV
jgi:hypothetical protein